jgi:tRNA threonylcarbamoyladenosine biosynthesis protein TsaB
MLLLAADTSGSHGSIALARGNPDGTCDVMEVVPLAGGTFSAQLVPQIAALLAKHGFTRNDLGGFAVASGPGSFTGLRVGLAAIKALAEILVKPIAAVSLLEAVAAAGRLQGRVAAVLDAGRGEIYAGEYDVAVDSVTPVRERILTKSEFVAEMRAEPVVTPDRVLAESFRASSLVVTIVEPLSAAAIARLGWRKIQTGAVVAPEQLEANYIRRSDAEIFAKGTLLGETIVLIRPATIADVAAIMELERQATTAAHWSEEQYMGLLAPGSDASSQRYALVGLAIEATGDSPQVGGTRGVEKSAILGFVVVRGLGAEWELENLVVEAAARRRGLGKQLMNELTALARVAGGQSVFLEVRESNSAARALYGSAGFEEKGRRKGYYANPVEDAVVYRLSLEPN